MNDRQILLIKKSWHQFLLNAEENEVLFFNRLFEMAPEVKQLFKGNLKELTKKFTSITTFMVSKLHNFEDALKEVKTIIQRNNQYKLSAEYYAFMGDALLCTLENGLAETWNDELKESWATAYFALADSMVRSEAE